MWAQLYFEVVCQCVLFLPGKTKLNYSVLNAILLKMSFSMHLVSLKNNLNYSKAINSREHIGFAHTNFPRHLNSPIDNYYNR